MREIEFRGKKYDTNDWIYGNLLDRDVIVACDSTDIDEEFIGISGEWSSVIPETVGQYVRKDRNKQDVYVGDIVVDKDSDKDQYGIIRQNKDDINCYIEWHYQRKYEGEMVWLTNGIPLRKIGEYEKVGNVWDNPELLKGVE